MPVPKQITLKSGATAWRVRYRDETGASREFQRRTRADAEAEMHKRLADIARGTSVDIKRNRAPFVDYFEQWFANHLVNLRPTTRATQESLARNHVLPRFGRRPIGAILSSEIESWVGKMHRDGLSASTIRACHALLSGCLKKATLDRIIAINPCNGTRNLPQLESGNIEKKCLSIAEIEALADAMPAQYRLMVLLGGFCGLRWGECAALTAHNVSVLTELSNNVTQLAQRRRASQVPCLWVEATLSEVKGQVQIGPPKTAKSKRRVTIPTFMVKEIKAHVERHGLGEGGLLFHDSRGGPLRHRNWRRRVFIPAVEASLGRHITFHYLRHSCVANLIAQGVQSEIISERLGHKSIKTTLDIYGGMLDGVDAVAAEALDEAYRAYRATSS